MYGWFQWEVFYALDAVVVNRESSTAAAAGDALLVKSQEKQDMIQLVVLLLLYGDNKNKTGVGEAYHLEKHAEES